MSITVAEYTAAVEREQMVRVVPFVLLSERVGVFEVLPLTLRHYVALRMIKSPFITGTMPGPRDASDLLQVVGATRVGRRMRAYTAPPEPRLHLHWLMARWARRAAPRLQRFAGLVQDIGEYLGEAMQDRPPTQDEPGPSYYCDAAALCHEMGQAYGWTVDTTMGMPVKVLFQVLKCIRADRQAKSGKVPLMFNPSDRLKADLQN